MDKYEFKLRIQEIDKLIEKEQYAEAVRIADAIDWRHVKKVSTLVKIAELYKINKRFEECKDLLEIGYDRNPYNKHVVYDLCEVCLEFGDVVTAVEYFKEYAQLAPNDIEIYFLKYRLYEANNVGSEEKIEVLEQLRSKTRIGIEEWEYELAYLYHRNGQTAKCVEICDEIILWNNEGPFVTKAMELKMLHEPLTPQQQYKYDHRNDEKYRLAAMAKQNAEVSPSSETGDLDFRVKTIDMSNKFNTINLQAELAQNVSEYLDDTNPIAYPANTDADMQEINVNTTGNMYAQMPQDMIYNTDSVNVPEATKVVATKEVQQALNNSNQNLAETVVFPRVSVAQENKAPEINVPVDETTSGADEEVFFSDKTSDIRFSVPAPEAATATVTPEMAAFREQYAKDMSGDVATPSVSTDTSEMKEITVDPGTGEIKTVEVNEVANAKVSAVVVPSKGTQVAKEVVSDEMEQYLSQDSDGQISMALDNRTDRVEKQITGQMSIDDILSDWERQKTSRTAALQDAINRRVTESTGRILAAADVESILDTIGKQKSNVVVPESQREVAETLEDEIVENIENSAEQVVTDEVPSEVVNEEPEHKYYGQVTDVLPGAIWKEVDAEPMKDDQVVEIVPDEIEEVAEAQPEAVSHAYEEPIETEASVEEVVEEEPVAEDEAIGDQVVETPEVVTEAPIVENIVNVKEADSTDNDDSDNSDTDEEITEETPVRDITKEEKKLFKEFLYSRVMMAQVVNALEKLSLASYTGNVVITSDGQEAGDKLAKLIIKYIQTSDDNFSGAIAKITSDKMNQKSVSAILERVQNGALIIDDASNLSDQSLNELYAALNTEESGIIVIMVDRRKKRITKMLDKVPALKEMFNAKINVIPMTTDALVDYGVKYAMKQEYSIDDMALLAFYKRVQDLHAGNHMVTLAEIRGIIDDAISKGAKKGLGKLFSGRKRDDDDRIILREKDFDK